MEIQVETSISTKASKIYTYQFELTDQEIDFLNSEKANNKNGTRTITFKNHNKENIVG
jgi:6-phosphogluconolactonase (cycloisomerase 2 family)